MFGINDRIYQQRENRSIIRNCIKRGIDLEDLVADSTGIYKLKQSTYEKEDKE